MRRNFQAYEKENRFISNHKGSTPILNEEESSQLSRDLENDVYTKIKDIQAHILEKFKKKMSHTAIRIWLGKHEFSYKKPILMPANIDKNAQEEHIKLYEQIEKQASLNGEPVLFGDGVHPTSQTRPAYGWFKRKGGKIIEVKSGRKRVNILGFHDLSTTAVYFQEYETINGEAAIDALKFLESQYEKAKKIHLFLDNAGYFTCKEVKEFLKTSKIIVYYLPPRSPNLNPIERLWKLMHAYISNNKTYENFKDFKAALFDFLTHKVKTKEVMAEIVSMVTDNFTVMGNYAK